MTALTPPTTVPTVATLVHLALAAAGLLSGSAGGLAAAALLLLLMGLRHLAAQRGALGARPLVVVGTGQAGGSTSAPSERAKARRLSGEKASMGG